MSALSSRPPAIQSGPTPATRSAGSRPRPRSPASCYSMLRRSGAARRSSPQAGASSPSSAGGRLIARRLTSPTVRSPRSNSTACSSARTSVRRRSKERHEGVPGAGPSDEAMKYAIVTFGCRVNQADSLAIEGNLLARGAVPSRPDDADVVVVNTCSVTATADQGARQTIRRIVRTNPSVRVVVTGCYATRRPDDVAALSNVAAVILNADKDALVDLIAGEIGLSTSDRFNGGDGPCGATVVPGVAGRTAFTLRVQTGCDEKCSYCII